MRKSRRKANKWKKIAQRLQRKFAADPGGPGAKVTMKKLDKAYKNWYDAMGAR